jgi:hypothetical protein
MEWGFRKIVTIKPTSYEITGKGHAFPEPELRHLRDLRHKLLHLHKSLLDMERANFEKVFGRVNSGELLQLVINHSQFAWLRLISALVVQIDEMLDADEPATLNEFQELLTQARMLFSSTKHEEFQQKYQDALQREPDIVVAHAEVMKLLGRQVEAGETVVEPDAHA